MKAAKKFMASNRKFLTRRQKAARQSRPTLHGAWAALLVCCCVWLACRWCVVGASSTAGGPWCTSTNQCVTGYIGVLVAAFVHFKSAESAQIATSDPLRLFGVLINVRYFTCVSWHATEVSAQTCLRVDDLCWLLPSLSSLPLCRTGPVLSNGGRAGQVHRCGRPSAEADDA